MTHSPPSRFTRKVTLLVIATQLFFVAACATNPVTGRRELALVSESQEIAMGKQYAPQIAASMGLYPNESLQNYLSEIGQPMALTSERPELPWQFKVVDDPVVNAFAVPGGFIYFTRGILAHMDSEAELASVLGHEIGHVTARHSVRQISKQQLAGLVLGVGSVLLPPELQGLGQLAGQSAQLLFLKFGRDDESQADGLGLRYMTNQGYEPREMVEMFRTLGRVSAAAGGGRVPEWMSTHPDPANREMRIAADIEQGALGAGDVGRDRFLDQLDGLVYGADPRQGFFVESRFHHPGMAIRIDFPNGWNTQNQTQAVVGVSPEKDAMVVLTHAGAETAQAAAEKLARSEGMKILGQRSVRVGDFPGIEISFQAQAQQGVIQGAVIFLEDGDNVIQLMGYAPAQQFEANRQAFASFLGSYARETDSRILGAEPWRLEIVRTPRSLSQADFARQFEGPVDAEELARLNQLDPGALYQANRRYKRVVGQAFGPRTNRR